MTHSTEEARCRCVVGICREDEQDGCCESHDCPAAPSSGTPEEARCEHGEPEGWCPSCASCAACRGECGECPYVSRFRPAEDGAR